MDKQGDTTDFLLTAQRDKKTVKPGLINFDTCGANTAAIQDCNEDYGKRIKIRQCKHLT